MNKRQGVLSGEQLALLRQHRQEWAAARKATEKADRAAAEDGIRQAYRAAKLAEPRKIIWSDGPVAMARDWVDRYGREKVGNPVKPAIVDAVQSRVVSEIDSSLSASIRLALFETRLIARDPVGVAVIEAVTDAAVAIKPTLGTRMRRLFRAMNTKSQRTRQANFSLSSFGQHDIGWLGICAFLRDAFNLGSETESLSGLWRVARNAGWVLPYEDVCWLSERHHILKFDDANRLHSPAGPALAYPDGWALHYWKGVRVPDWIVDRPDLLTPSAIDREMNRNVRRGMIDIMTPEKFVSVSGAVPVSVDETGVLWRKQWFRDAWAAVEVVNGTPEPDGTRRHYFLQVPPDLHSAREAVAWTYGMTAQQYAGLRVRT
jgi:hypothetical protein